MLMSEYKIPLIDLQEQSVRLGDELLSRVKNVIMSAQYIMGNEVKTFEESFAKFIGTKHAISCGNGTDALVLALEALGVGNGDEVITTTYTFFATAESIAYVGAKPVFIDVNPETFNMDAALIEKAITSKTKAIMPVHLFGQACKMDEIMAIASKHNLYVIEDACQAVGGSYKGQMLGTFGDVACFSFFPTKNLGAAGDGGMIVTSNDRIATTLKALRVHGSGENGKAALTYRNESSLDALNCDTPDGLNLDNTVYNASKYYNYIVGHNSRLDELQAAVLNVKLNYLNEWNERRSVLAQNYSDQLSSLQTKGQFKVPYTSTDVKHVYHMYILKAENKEALTNYLASKGIATGIYYPVPLHLQKAFENLGYKVGDFPVAEYLSKRTFAIPMYAELTDEQQAYIISTINNYANTI